MSESNTNIPVEAREFVAPDDSVEGYGETEEDHSGVDQADRPLSTMDVSNTRIGNETITLKQYTDGEVVYGNGHAMGGGGSDPDRGDNVIMFDPKDPRTRQNRRQHHPEENLATSEKSRRF